MAFLYQGHRRLRRKFIVVMDRYSSHRKAVNTSVGDTRHNTHLIRSFFKHAELEL